MKLSSSTILSLQSAGHDENARDASAIAAEQLKQVTEFAHHEVNRLGIALRATVIERDSLRVVNTDLELEAKAMEHTNDQDSPANTPAVQAPPTAVATAGNMLVQAAQLAALSRASSVFAEKATGMLEKSGIESKLLRDPKVQSLIGAIVPLLLMQFGDKIPGVKNMAALQPLAQQQLIIKMAEVMDIAMSDVFGMLASTVTELNAGDVTNVEQLHGTVLQSFDCVLGNGHSPVWKSETDNAERLRCPDFQSGCR